jgi:NADH-quinone oxidoreductase subunit C
MVDAQPHIQSLSDLGGTIASQLGASITSIEIINRELVLHAERAAIVKVLTFLRDDVNCQFKLLMELCGVDYPERENRFDVVYCLLSLTQNHERL